MKKILVLAILFLSVNAFKVKSQISVHINIGSQPVWGPVGYDYVDYYYMPDIDAYYDVTRQQFVYYDMGRWVFGYSLPPRYGNYDLYRSYKVVLNEREPWLRNNYYHQKFYAYRGRRQPIIRDSHDSRYFVIKNHPEHNKYNGNGSFERRDYRGNGGRGNEERRDHEEHRERDKDDHGHHHG